MSYFYETDGTTLGCFQHTETKCQFEYRKTLNEWAMAHNLPHEIAVNDPVGYGWRFGRVLKTVAYVAVDEQDDGPLMEKWPIRNREYERTPRFL